jgi:cell filamentation protein
MKDRYDTSDNPEDAYYPGTSVLKNLEDISDPDRLLERETELLLSFYQELFTSFDEKVIPDLAFFYSLHKRTFHSLYSWAGCPRTVGISKYGTLFCPPQNISVMMNSIIEELHQENWLKGLGRESFLERAAYYICEINAIHPFREGNGRIIRLYFDVLAVCAMADLFDWTLTTQNEYLQACINGFNQDYRLMLDILKRCFSQSIDADDAD